MTLEQLNKIGFFLCRLKVKNLDEKHAKTQSLKLRNLTNKSSGSSSSSHVNLKSFMSPFFIHSRVVLNFLKILDDMKDPFAYDSYDYDLEKQHKTLA